jgi:EmrB/QacA subfamily drug resistance transporter
MYAPDVGSYPAQRESRRLVTAALLAALFVSAISQTVIATALPRMIGELGGLDLYSWVLTSSMLAMTAAMPLVGKLSDVYGRKPFLIGGIVLFMITTALTGASQNMVQLIAFRGLQGVAAGTIQASAFAAIGDLFEPAERGRYFGLFTGAFAVASVAGPLLGGFVTDHWGWRWVFYISIPFGLLALLALAKGMPGSGRPRVQGAIDWAGMAALLWAVVPLLLALSWAGGEFGWASPHVAALVAVAVAGTVAFAFIEHRAADPVLPPMLFRERTFVVASLVSFLTGIGLFGALSYMPLFIQGTLGASATNSGLVNAPMMLGLTSASLVAGNVASRTGRYRWMVVVGGGVLAGGMAIMASLDEHVSLLLPIAGMVVVGLGLGLNMPLLGLAVQNALSNRLLGVATASTQFFRQVGGTLGIAIFGSVVTARLHQDLLGSLPPEVTSAAPPDVLARLEEPRILLSPAALAKLREAFEGAFGAGGPDLFDGTVGAMRAVLADGLHEVFLLGLIVAVLAVAVSLFLPERLLQTGEVNVGPAPDSAAEDGAWAFEGRALFDVLLLGESWHDVKRAEGTPEPLIAAPW